MCSDMGQSALMHSLMDALERAAWYLFAIEVLKCDAWLWINGTDSGYTFQSTQFRSTWSRLARIYIMHDERFLPEVLIMQVYRGIASSDHFPVIYTHQGVDGFKSLLGRPSLRFNSSFLEHECFRPAMGQLVGEFRKVNIGGASSWDVCLSNIQWFARYYGISQAIVRKKKVRALQQLLHRCKLCFVGLKPAR